MGFLLKGGGGEGICMLMNFDVNVKMKRVIVNFFFIIKLNYWELNVNLKLL